MTKRLLYIVIVVPVAIVLIALAVANRSSVPFTIDPFNPGNPALTVEAPLFVYLFAACALGVCVGGVMTWLRQGRYRKLARTRGREAEEMRVRAEQEKAAREATFRSTATAGLPAPAAH